MKNTQKGFGVLSVVLVLVIVGVVVFAGMRVLNTQEEEAPNGTTTTQVAEEVPEINNTDDLQKTEEFLDETNLDDIDTTELDEAEEELL